MRIVSVIILFGLINIYAAARIIHRWPWAEQHAAGAWTAALLFFLLQLLAPFGDRLFMPRLRKNHFAALASTVDWLSYMAFGIMSLLVVYGLMIDLVSILLQLFDSGFEPSIFDQYALYVIFAVTFTTILLGAANVWRGPEVKNVDIFLENLPAVFDGFKIVQVSDLHVGAAIRRKYTQNVVNIVTAQKADLIALTGDFVDGSVDDLIDDIRPLSSLRAPEGVFFITGNHEYYSGVYEWINVFRNMGMRVLLNEHDVIKRGRDAFVLAGVTDYSAGRTIQSHASDPFKALRGAPAGLVNILLAHQPVIYEQAEKAGFNLQLSGHTHSGQYFPFTVLIRFFQRFYNGLNRYKNLQIYVNRGTGYWGPPLRSGARAEITLITLRRKSA
jgi:predicted MPP superfamily phosphohydrolase